MTLAKRLVKSFENAFFAARVSASRFGNKEATGTLRREKWMTPLGRNVDNPFVPKGDANRSNSPAGPGFHGGNWTLPQPLPQPQCRVRLLRACLQRYDHGSLGTKRKEASEAYPKQLETFHLFPRNRNPTLTAIPFLAFLLPGSSLLRYLHDDGDDDDDD